MEGMKEVLDGAVLLQKKVVGVVLLLEKVGAMMMHQIAKMKNLKNPQVGETPCKLNPTTSINPNPEAKAASSAGKKDICQGIVQIRRAGQKSNASTVVKKAICPESALRKRRKGDQRFVSTASRIDFEPMAQIKIS